MTFIAYIDPSHMLMHDVPTGILGSKSLVDLFTLSPAQFLPSPQPLKGGQLPPCHGKLNLHCWIGQDRLGWQYLHKLSDGVELGLFQAPTRHHAIDRYNRGHTL